MAKYEAESFYVASIYPGQLEPVKLYHGTSPDARQGRCTTYTMKPVARGKKACTIEVFDAFETVIDPMQTMQQGVVTRTPRPVSGQNTADVLVSYWAANIHGMPQGAGPGVMRIVGTVPTEQEKAIMTAQLSKYAEWRFMKGERLHAEKKIDQITDEMVLMAKWLGRQTAWSDPGMALEMVECPECTGLIKPHAKVCIHCKRAVKFDAHVAESELAGTAA